MLSIQNCTVWFCKFWPHFCSTCSTTCSSFLFMCQVCCAGDHFPDITLSWQNAPHPTSDASIVMCTFGFGIMHGVPICRCLCVAHQLKDLEDLPGEPHPPLWVVLSHRFRDKFLKQAIIDATQLCVLLSCH